MHPKVGLFVLLGIIIGWEVGFLTRAYTLPQEVFSKKIETTPIPTPQMGIPQSLLIPSLNIYASVESVGEIDGSRMDVPKNTRDVAWYNQGPRPGEAGNVVIDGHYDTDTGAAAVFYDLKNIRIGDPIQIIDRDNNLSYYKVTQVKSFTNDTFPFSTIFGQGKKAKLYLITCDGVWDRQEQNYSNRLVVSAELEK